MKVSLMTKKENLVQSLPLSGEAFFQTISTLQNKNCFSIKTRFTNGYEGSIWMICIKVKQGLKKKKHATSYLLVCKCSDGQKMFSRSFHDLKQCAMYKD